MRSGNDAVRFVLELCALAAIAYWGWRTGGSMPSKLLVTVGAVALVATVWAVFRSESGAPVEVPTVVRIVIEVAVFAAAAAALAAVARIWLAVAFALVAVSNEILNYALD